MATAAESPLITSAQPGSRPRRLRTVGALVLVGFMVAVAVYSLAFDSAFSKHSNEDTFLRALRDLDKRMEGRVILPTDKEFSDACVVWNQVSSLLPSPKAVIEVASEHDVQLAIQVLATLDVPFSIRSGGHSKAGYSNAPDGIIISLGRLNQIQIIEESLREGALVKIGPAITSPEVLNITVPMGYAAVVGLCPTVAEGGFVLGGGYGIMSRRHGLGLDNLVSANVVLSSSEVIVANSTHNSDLFWALRGAGIGNFGVVTEMTYRLHPSQEEIIMGLLAMPLQQASTFLERVASKELPRDMIMILENEGASSAPFPLPFPTEGKAVFALMWACPDPMCVNAGRLFLREELATLVNDTELILHNSTTWLSHPTGKAAIDYTKMVQSFTGFLYPENATLRNLQTIVETFHNWTEEMAPYVAADIELWAGKISDIAPDATAFPHRGALYNLGVVVSVPKERPAVFANVTQRLSRDWQQIAQFLNGAYVNYQMASLSSNEYAKTYWGPHVQRLQEIKSKYDPSSLFKYPQGIPMARN